MENNVQKMREAARHLLCVIDEMGFKPWCADDPLAIACDKLDAYLALPLKNCDVGTAEEQIYLHREWCNRDNDSSYCCNDCRDCFARWAQMPYESEAAR